MAAQAAVTLPPAEVVKEEREASRLGSIPRWGAKGGDGPERRRREETGGECLEGGEFLEKSFLAVSPTETSSCTCESRNWYS